MDFYKGRFSYLSKIEFKTPFLFPDPIKFYFFAFKATGPFNIVTIIPAGKYWSPRRPPPTSPGGPLKILFDRPGDVPI